MFKWLLFTMAILLVVLIPFAPRLLRLRIRLLRWLHWNWAASLLENHFPGWVFFVRVLLFVIAVVVFYIGWAR
jgi:hypothetical protein